MLLPLDPAFHEKVKRLQLDDHIVHENDFTYDLFALRTLERSYLMRDEHSRIVERPQYMLMRAPLLCLSGRGRQLLLLSFKGTPRHADAVQRGHAQRSVRVLLPRCHAKRSLAFSTLSSSALSFKTAGSIGLSISNIRSTGSHIQGAMGKSNGIVPMLQRVQRDGAHVDQGRRRKGSFAMYLEPWHPDIEAFLDLRKNHGDENSKARPVRHSGCLIFSCRESWRTNSGPSSAQRQSTCGLPLGAVQRDIRQAEQTLPGRKIRARDLWENYSLSDQPARPTSCSRTV